MFLVHFFPFTTLRTVDLKSTDVVYRMI